MSGNMKLALMAALAIGAVSVEDPHRVPDKSINFCDTVHKFHISQFYSECDGLPTQATPAPVPIASIVQSIVTEAHHAPTGLPKFPYHSVLGAKETAAPLQARDEPVLGHPHRPSGLPHHHSGEPHHSRPHAMPTGVVAREAEHWPHDGPWGPHSKPSGALPWGPHPTGHHVAGAGPGEDHPTVVLEENVEFVPRAAPASARPGLPIPTGFPGFPVPTGFPVPSDIPFPVGPDGHHSRPHAGPTGLPHPTQLERRAEPSGIKRRAEPSGIKRRAEPSGIKRRQAGPSGVAGPNFARRAEPSGIKHQAARRQAAPSGIPRPSFARRAEPSGIKHQAARRQAGPSGAPRPSFARRAEPSGMTHPSFARRAEPSGIKRRAEPSGIKRRQAGPSAIPRPSFARRAAPSGVHTSHSRPSATTSA